MSELSVQAEEALERYKPMVKLVGGSTEIKRRLIKQAEDQNLPRPELLVWLTASLVAAHPHVKLMLDLSRSGEEVLLDVVRDRVHEAASEDGAQRLLASCLEHVRGLLMHNAHSDEFANRVRSTVAEFAAHFSGKMTHSKAEDASMLCAAASTALPHVCSRSLRACGIDLPLDQKKQDTSKFYGSVAKLLNDETLAQQVGLPPSFIDLVRSLARNGFDLARRNRPTRVDWRLRQILLPSGDEYLAVTPLGSPGFMMLVNQTCERLEQRWQEEAEAAQPAQASAEEAAEEPAKKGRGRKKTKERERKKETKVKIRRFTSLTMKYGGENPQNISLMPSKSLQRSVFFDAPQKDWRIAKFVRFAHRGIDLQIDDDDVESVRDHLSGLVKRFGDKTSLSIRGYYATGALKNLVLRLHRHAKSMHDLVKEMETPMGHFDLSETIGQMQNEQSQTLANSIALGQFDQGYREAMAARIIRILWRRMNTPDGCILDDMAVRETAKSAICDILEQAT